MNTSRNRSANAPGLSTPEKAGLVEAARADMLEATPRELGMRVEHLAGAVKR